MADDHAVASRGREGAVGDGAETVRAGSIDGRHLLLIGAGPGLGGALARRFAEGGYRATLVARSKDALAKLAGDLSDTGVDIDTIAVDVSDLEALSARMRRALQRGRAHLGSLSTTPSWELRTDC